MARIPAFDELSKLNISKFSILWKVSGCWVFHKIIQINQNYQHLISCIPVFSIFIFPLKYFQYLVFSYFHFSTPSAWLGSSLLSSSLLWSPSYSGIYAKIMTTRKINGRLHIYIQAEMKNE